jgi:adenine-specific DNA-methyltransferase
MSPEEFYTKEERKTNGVFYTPTFLSQYLVKKVGQYFTASKIIKTVLDPACGDGILLRSLADEMKGRPGNSPKVFGIDKDINAIISATSNFSSKTYKRINSRFIHADGLFPYAGMRSSDDWVKLKKELKSKNGFDIILSNPPWGAELNGYEQRLLSNNFTLAKGQFDIFDLFTEVILDNLNSNGVYGLILPDSVFSQEQARFRCLLSKNTTIHLVARLGEKIFPEINRACSIIIGKKLPAPTNHLVDCFRLSSSYKKRVMSTELSLEEVERELVHKVPQSRFLGNDNCEFDIDLRIDEQKTFDKIQQNSFSLKQLVINTRGAEISKKGIVCKCIYCKNWMPFPKSKTPKCPTCNSIIEVGSLERDNIVLNHNGRGKVKLKVGEDLYRFTSFSKS